MKIIELKNILINLEGYEEDLVKGILEGIESERQRVLKEAELERQQKLEESELERNRNLEDT